MPFLVEDWEVYVVELSDRELEHAYASRETLRFDFPNGASVEISKVSKNQTSPAESPRYSGQVIVFSAKPGRTQRSSQTPLTTLKYVPTPDGDLMGLSIAPIF